MATFLGEGKAMDLDDDMLATLEKRIDALEAGRAQDRFEMRCQPAVEEGLVVFRNKFRDSCTRANEGRPVQATDGTHLSVTSIVKLMLGTEQTGVIPSAVAEHVRGFCNTCDASLDDLERFLELTEELAPGCNERVHSLPFKNLKAYLKGDGGTLAKAIADVKGLGDDFEDSDTSEFLMALEGLQKFNLLALLE